MDKKQELLKLKLDLQSRKDIPLIKSANDVVFGDGNPDSEIVFIGEAAGYYESIEHKPFVGQSGKLLIKTLNEIVGVDRKDVYITNIVKARPPENRDPFPEEIEMFRPYLDKELEIIKPRIIVTLGRFSMAKFIPGVTISQIHGQARFYELPTMNYKPIIFPMYHPAAALRGTTMLMAFKEDFVKLKNLLYPVAVIAEKDPDLVQKSLF
ncbi:MAG: uracil-DNA glycosylase [Patescibacteria group bacterium]